MSKLRYNPESLINLVEKGRGDWSKIIDYLGDENLSNQRTPQRITNLADLTHYIDSSNQIEHLNVADNNLNSISSMIQNPGDAIVLAGVKQDINNKRIEINNYKEYLNVASQMATNFENYRVDDYKNMTLEDINKELRRIRDFNSYIYEDLEKKEFNKFVGHHSSGGRNDKQIINRINEYEKSLMTTIEALYNDGVVQDHEVFFILTGNEEGLRNARTEILRLQMTV